MMQRWLAWGIVLILAAGMAPVSTPPLVECRLTHQVMAAASPSAVAPSCCAPSSRS